MPRPISWLPRLHEIRRSVEQSVRSHYTRAELQHLFQLQQRQAGDLMKLMDTTRVGGADLVSKETLAAFLEQVREAEDVPALLAVLRDRGSKPSYRKLRHLVRADVAPVSLDAVPPSIELQRGALRIQFETMEELGAALLQVAQLLRDQGDEFTVRYEPVRVSQETVAAREEMAGLFAGLRRMEAARSKRRPGASRQDARQTAA